MVAPTGADRLVLGGWSSGLGTGRRGRRPLRVRIFHPVRIPYAERIIATGREILLEYQHAQSARHEFGPGPAGFFGFFQRLTLTILHSFVILYLGNFTKNC